MNVFKRFIIPVYKTDQTNRPIEAGESVVFILKDGLPQTETLTIVEDGGRKVYWDQSVNGTRVEDVRGVSSVHHKSCLYYGGAVDPGGEEILWS